MNPVPTDPEIVEAAKRYAARGWSVLPVGPDKKPRVRTWKHCQQFLITPEQAEDWFGRLKGVSGVGVVLGAVSGDIYARDFDDAGEYERWRESHQDLATTLPTTRTARGFHVYARWRGVRTAEVAGGELRGEGSYVVAPPSQHSSGVFYEWCIPLPEGPLPEVDPVATGLALPSPTKAGKRATERTERKETTETPETPETTEETEDNGDTEAIWGDQTLRARILQAIRRTIPPQFGRRNYHVFKFARALRGMPEFAGIPVAKIKRLRPIVLEWHRQSLPTIITRDFGVTWGDFAHGWGRVKYPEGSDAVAAALAAAEAAAPPEWSADYSPECRLLASLCRELQRRAGADPFFLSADTAASLVGKDKTTAARWFKAFVADGALVVVVPGTRETRKATRYRYVHSDLHESK